MADVAGHPEALTSELHRVQEQLALAVAATGLGIFDFNPVSGSLEWDARVRELFGVGAQETVTYDETFLTAVHPDDRDAAHAAVLSALDPAGAGVFETDYRIRPHDGGPERWLAARGQAIFGDGRPVRFVGSVRDITTRRASDETLRITEERYRLAARATTDAIWDWDLKTNHVLWNEALHTAYQWPPEEVEETGDWWIAHIHPDDRERVTHSIHEVIDGIGEAWSDTYRFRRRDGSYAFVLDRGYVLRDAAGRAVRMIGAMLDSTERVRAETERKDHAQQLEALNASLEQQVVERTRERNRVWETTNDLMGTAGLDGYLKAVNPAWTTLLDWSEADLLAKPFTEIIDPADLAETADVVRRLAAGRIVTDFLNRIFTRDGGKREIMWNAVPAGDGALFYIVGRDVTAQRQVEDALRQSQKMEAVGQLTGGLAHDFNNLLAGITGSLELMQTRMSQGRLSELDRYITAAQGAARRAAALTHRLLAFSRRQTLDPKPTDANRLIAGMEDMVRRTIGPSVTLEVVAAGGLWSTLVDASQLENALLNLSINARDAMPGGGRITIETANKWLDDTGARERDLPPGQYVSICVTDTGTGMTRDVIAKAFEPFFTTKPLGQGTGLGLSMIYGFVRQSGGQVRIYSEVGEGTTMCLYLPRHYGSETASMGGGDLIAAPRAADGETVLIVDDEPTVRMLVIDVLEDLGYTAIEAADGPAGLRVLDSGVRIDLLITDVGLPGGMNGRQMADAARVRRPDLKVLFITGYAENAIIGNGQLTPGMAILTKPFVMDALAARIREMIER